MIQVQTEKDSPWREFTNPNWEGELRGMKFRLAEKPLYEVYGHAPGWDAVRKQNLIEE